MGLEYLMNRFLYLQCPNLECNHIFGLPWDLFTHAYCPECKNLVEVRTNQLQKPSNELQLELKHNYHYRKRDENLPR